MAVAEAFVVLLFLYAGAGLAFAVPFLARGVERIDSQARGAGLGFLLIVLPGVVAFWPLLLRRWIAGNPELRPQGMPNGLPHQTSLRTWHRRAVFVLAPLLAAIFAAGLAFRHGDLPRNPALKSDTAKREGRAPAARRFNTTRPEDLR